MADRGTFEPFSGHGSAQRLDDGKIVGTMPLAAESGLRIVSAEVVWDGQALTCVFEEVDDA